jgi:DNA-directed RNA polymerase specialized sigma24 family protein
MVKRNSGPALNLTLLTFTTQVPTSWTTLVQDVAAGKPAATEELYRLSAFVRPYLARTVGWNDVEDIYHDIVVEVIERIRKGALREPEALMGYVKTIAFRRGIVGLRQKVRSRQESAVEHHTFRSKEPSPLAMVVQKESDAIISRVFAGLLPFDRELLTRFYVNEECRDDIEKAMGLSRTQFRLEKSRVKANFARRCQTALARRRPSQSTPAGQPPLALAC